MGVFLAKASTLKREHVFVKIYLILLIDQLLSVQEVPTGRPEHAKQRKMFDVGEWVTRMKYSGIRKTIRKLLRNHRLIDILDSGTYRGTYRLAWKLEA